MERPARTARGRNLICFDMEGTLVDGETLDAIADRMGIGDEVSRITCMAMDGMIDFEEAVRRRLALIRGFPVSSITEIADSMPLMPGAAELVRELKRKGFVAGMITGGFSVVADRIARRLGLDFCLSNEIYSEDGLLTGGFGLRVNGNKEEHMRREAERFGASTVFAVGDGANDLGMILAADVGIAFCPKPSLERSARNCIREKDLMRVMDFVGGEPHAD